LSVIIGRTMNELHLICSHFIIKGTPVKNVLKIAPLEYN
jgi:hypothetical protein